MCRPDAEVNLGSRPGRVVGMLRRIGRDTLRCADAPGPQGPRSSRASGTQNHVGTPELLCSGLGEGSGSSSAGSLAAGGRSGELARPPLHPKGT